MSSFRQPVGPSRVLPEEASLTSFCCLLTTEILNNVVREKNRYAQQNLQAQSKDPSACTEVTLQELKAFLRLLIAMSIYRLPSTWNYWSTDWVLGLPAFAKVMPRNRFLENMEQPPFSRQLKNAKAWK